MNTTRIHTALLAAAGFCLTTTFGTPDTANAYLGGFEQVDGYGSFLNEVSTTNAGAHGANAGGGALMTIPANSGLWVKLQGPTYPTPGTAGGVAYATGHQNWDRLNPGTPAQALVITTNADGWSGTAQEYSYSLDTYDLGGVSPTSTGSDTLEISFWSCAQIVGSSDPSAGLGPGTIGDTIGFYDSSGNLGFSIGYRQPGTTTDYAATNVGSWVQSSVAVNSSTYHRWDITLDLLNDTVSIDVFESGVLTNLVSGVSLITNMNNLTEMRFESTPGVNNSKIWSLDDFGFEVHQVPEPSMAGLMCIGALAVSGSRTLRQSRRNG